MNMVKIYTPYLVVFTEMYYGKLSKTMYYCIAVGIAYKISIFKEGEDESCPKQQSGP